MFALIADVEVNPALGAICAVYIFIYLWIQMSSLMNQTYFEWYEFDVNVVSIILIATCTYKSTCCSEYEWVTVHSKIAILLTHSVAYIQNFMSAYEYKKYDSLLISGMYTSYIN